MISYKEIRSIRLWVAGLACIVACVPIFVTGCGPDRRVRAAGNEEASRQFLVKGGSWFACYENNEKSSIVQFRGITTRFVADHKKHAEDKKQNDILRHGTLNFYCEVNRSYCTNIGWTVWETYKKLPNGEKAPFFWMEMFEFKDRVVVKGYYHDSSRDLLPYSRQPPQAAVERALRGVLL